MDLQIVNPIDYAGWDALLLRSGDYSFFHASGWARVLAESYGYKPIYFTASENGRLSVLMPFMEISSRLTGKRGVSLPFTDDCDPFAPEKNRLREAAEAAIGYGKQKGWGYIEWRCKGDFIEGTTPSESFWTHDLDLERSPSELFSRLKENNRRNIRKSTKDGVTVEFDSSPESLKEFYRLHCRTRRGHGLPPQPFSFFKNVLDDVLAQGLGTIASARYSGKTIASSVFFHFGTNAIFKYGASDAGSLSHRPNNLVMWEAIKWYKGRGAKSLSLGRTQADHHGLLHFKRSWGARESGLNYYRYDFGRKAFSPTPLRGNHPRKLFSMAPIGVLRIMGRLFYRHIG
ncbi:MAG: lipid II:glycine glycyltransferase FemX [Bdellovibrionota bacterium]